MSSQRVRERMSPQKLKSGNTSPSKMNTSTSKLNISGIMNESRVDYQTYESFINTKTDDEDQGPSSNFLNDKIYDKIVRKVIKLNSPAKKRPIAKVE